MKKEFMVKETAPIIDWEILTLAEAAVFLRFSESTLYQRHDIPRHRVPGSRELRFIRSELFAWLKGEHVSQADAPTEGAGQTPTAAVVDIGRRAIYHRNARYR